MSTLRGSVRPLSGAPADYDPLIETISGARFALIGEASHGTHEFYRERAEIPELVEIREPRLERAIGVIYRPESERASHYFHASLPDQFDAVIHIDDTRAVEPLEREAAWGAAEGETPETFPSGV